jgi:hypothetical protein
MGVADRMSGPWTPDIEGGPEPVEGAPKSRRLPPQEIRVIQIGD